MTDDLTAAVARLRNLQPVLDGDTDMSEVRNDDVRLVLAALEAAQPAEPTIAPHVDDLCVDRFAAAMKAKLAKKRAEGYGGWNDADECPPGRLASLLHSHLAKGDPLDIGNFAMMLWNRGESCARPAEPPATDGPAAERAEAERDALRECVRAADAMRGDYIESWRDGDAAEHEADCAKWPSIAAYDRARAKWGDK